MWRIISDAASMMRKTMNTRSYIIIAALLVSVIGLLFGCTSGKHAFLTVQVCLRDKQDIERLANMMKSTAQLEGMTFTDDSENAQSELSTLGTAPNYRIISLWVSRDDGQGMTASNLGLHAYQVAIGFGEGSNTVEAHKFAESFIGKLKQWWHVYYVPAGEGAFPMKTCE